MIRKVKLTLTADPDLKNAMKEGKKNISELLDWAMRLELGLLKVKPGGNEEVLELKKMLRASRKRAKEIRQYAIKYKKLYDASVRVREF